MAMSPLLKNGLRWTSSLLAIAGILFVTLRLVEYGAEIDLRRFNSSDWLILAALAFIYGLANYLLATAWWSLLKYFRADLPRNWAVKAYGLSQIARYVPGNIFQFTGRQTLGMAAGVSGWALAKSAVWEIGLIAVAGAMYGWLALPLLAPSFPSVAAVTLFVISGGLFTCFLRKFIGQPVAVAFGWQLLFLAISAGVFVALTNALIVVDKLDAHAWILLVGAYIIAWLAGLVTPGAPAGVGVRELVLMILLNGMVSEAELLMAVLLGRVVTVTGDCLFFLAALSWKPKAFRLESSGS